MRRSWAGAKVGTAGTGVGLGVAVGNGVEVGAGVAVGNGVAVGVGGTVGNGVAVGGAVGNGVAVGGAVGKGAAVGVDVALVGAMVSTIMTGAVAVGSAALSGTEVAVGSAALFGTDVAVGGAPGVAVGLMRITLGVGVAVADACRASASESGAGTRWFEPQIDALLSAVRATPTPRLMTSNTRTIPVVATRRCMFVFTTPDTPSQSWQSRNR